MALVRTRSILVMLSLAAVLLALPREVFAQMVSLQTAGITRKNSDGSEATGTTTNFMNVFARINGADCYGTDDKGITYSFPVTVRSDPNPSSNHLEVWAGGTDCSPLAARSGTSATCWPVIEGKPPSLSTIQDIRVRAQDVVSQIAASAKTLTYVAATSQACTVIATEAKVTLYFLLIDGTGNNVGTGAAWPMKIKLVGPAAPTNVTAQGLDRAVTVSWTASTDITLVGYSIFVDTGGVSDAAVSSGDASGTIVTTCNDAGVDDAGNPLLDDAGVPLDAGCTETIVYDAGGAGSGTCSSGNLVAGGRADQLEASSTPGKTDTSGTVGNLANGSSYAVAVATRDTYDNVGPLSAPACVAPEPIQDFWSRYKGAGGQAGGFCAMGSEPISGGGLALVLGVAIAAWARRRGGRG